MTTEKKYIDVDEAFEVITDFAGQAETKSAYGAYWKAAKALKKLPSVSMPIIRIGRWIEDTYSNGTYDADCSECGEKIRWDGCQTSWNYCPNCGTKMENGD